MRTTIGHSRSCGRSFFPGPAKLGALAVVRLTEVFRSGRAKPHHQQRAPHYSVSWGKRCPSSQIRHSNLQGFREVIIICGGGTRRCISCRAEMRVLQVEQDHSMKAAGYEHQTLECSRCKKTERRLALTGDKALWRKYWRSLIALDAAAGELPFYQYLVGRQGLPQATGAPIRSPRPGESRPASRLRVERLRRPACAYPRPSCHANPIR